MSTSIPLGTGSSSCFSSVEPEADPADGAGEASGAGLVCWARSRRAWGRRGRGMCLSTRGPRSRPRPLPRGRLRPRPGRGISDQFSLQLRPIGCLQRFRGFVGPREYREGDRAGEPLPNLRPSKWHWHLFRPRPAWIDRDPILGDGKRKKVNKGRCCLSHNELCP